MSSHHGFQTQLCPSLYATVDTLQKRKCSRAVLVQVVNHELSVPDVTQLLLSVACWATARATGALLADLPGLPCRTNLEPFWGVGAIVAIAAVRAHLATGSASLLAFNREQLSCSGNLLCMMKTLMDHQHRVRCSL